MAIRSWLVFFGPAPPGWWDWFTSPPFRHVLAAGCDAETRTWVFYDPERRGTQIEVMSWDSPAVEARLTMLSYTCAPHILRCTPRRERSLCPPAFGCVGAIKALLGVRAPRALLPEQLFRHLLRNGAELVPVRIDGEPIQQTGSPEDGPAGLGAAAA